jgi:predicted nuclease of predicted toxin-antitoxin system
VKVLFDHNVPKKLRSLLPRHEVSTSRELGWDALKNGELLAAAEANGFQVMVTGDKNLSYQQNLKDRKLALVVLGSTDWNTVKEHGWWTSCRRARCCHAWQFQGAGIRTATKPGAHSQPDRTRKLG